MTIAVMASSRLLIRKWPVRRWATSGFLTSGFIEPKFRYQSSEMAYKIELLLAKPVCRQLLSPETCAISHVRFCRFVNSKRRIPNPRYRKSGRSYCSRFLQTNAKEQAHCACNALLFFGYLDLEHFTRRVNFEKYYFVENIFGFKQLTRTAACHYKSANWAPNPTTLGAASSGLETVATQQARFAI